MIHPGWHLTYRETTVRSTKLKTKKNEWTYREEEEKLALEASIQPAETRIGNVRNTRVVRVASLGIVGALFCARLAEPLSATKNEKFDNWNIIFEYVD